MEAVYRKPTVELCARARSARVVAAVMAAGAGGTIAAVFMHLRHRGSEAGGKVRDALDRLRSAE